MSVPGAAATPSALGLSTAARLPAALLPVALLAAVGLSTRSLFTTGIVVAVALTGLALSGPLAAAAAARWGHRPTLLAGAVAHVITLVLLVTAVDRFTQRDVISSDLALFFLVVGFAALAGLTVPPVAGVSRGRWQHLRRRPAGQAVPLDRGLRTEATMEDAALILASLLTAVLAWTAHPTAGLLAAAAITAVAVPLYAMDSVIGGMDEVLSVQEQQDIQEDESEAPLRVILPGSEQAQRRLRQAREPGPSGPNDASQGLERGWRKVLLPVLGGGSGLGGAVALTWLSALSSALAVYRGAWLTFVVLAVLAAASTVTARGLPQGLSNLADSRRRRLLTTLLVLSVLGTLLGGALLSGWPGLLAAALGSALVGLCAGALVVELHLMLTTVPEPYLSPTVTLLAGAMLAGLVFGFTAGGSLMDALR